MRRKTLGMLGRRMELSTLVGQGRSSCIFPLQGSTLLDVQFTHAEKATTCHGKGTSCLYMPALQGILQRGRILGMPGREGAQEVYRETVQQAAGVSADSFVKALASLWSSYGYEAGHSSADRTAVGRRSLCRRRIGRS